MNEKIIKEEFHRRTSYYKNVTVPLLFQGQYNDYETELAFNRSSNKIIVPRSYNYKITKKVELDGVKFQKGDYYYLDNLHKDHIETFSTNDVSKGVFNLYSTYNDRKSEKAKKRKEPGYRG